MSAETPSPVFPLLDLLLDPCPRSAAANMGFDEALLRSVPPHPILRFYHWRSPSVSFGYFQPWNTVAAFLPDGVEAVRRWTGGGLVDHRGAVTYSLIVPASCSLARISPRESYGWIHEQLASTLRTFGYACHLAPEALEPQFAAGRCFAGGHARHDVLLSGRKIAGAAQRRHRLGLLHQGSLALSELPESFPRRFAAMLASDTVNTDPPGNLEAQTAALVATRYGTTVWRHLR